MKIWHILKRDLYEQQMAQNGCLASETGFLHACTPSQRPLLQRTLQPDEIILVLDDLNPSLQVRYEPDQNSQHFPHIYGKIQPKDIREILEEPTAEQVNVLLSTSMLDEKWIRPWMQKLISKTDRVCVVALSYFDDTKTEEDWNRQYAPGRGIYYPGNNDVFFPYGLKQEQITWICPWQDTPQEMEDKIRRASILMLCGGAPDLYMKRLRKLRLKKPLQQFCGLVIGYSAGAMIQLADYHISVDPDYDQFSWQKGLGLLRGLDVEVHFARRREQMEGIQNVLEQKAVPVYALYEDGALVCRNGKPWQCFGSTELFEPN